MHRIESGKRQYAQYAVISPIGFIALATVLAPASRAVAFPCSRRGTHRASARERAYKFVKYWPARSSALAFVARSVLQGENGTRSDVCRELSTVTPPCPFLPSLPAAALRCLGRAIDFPFPFLPQRNATVFGAARSSCVAALMRPERLGYRGFDRRSFGWPRVADGTMVSMRTVDKWRRSGRFFFLLN